MNISGLYKNIKLNNLNTPTFTARKAELKQDKVDISSKTAVFDKKLHQIEDAVQDTVDPKVVKRGINEVKKLLKFIDSKKSIPENYEKALKEFEPKLFDEDLATAIDILNSDYQDNPDKKESFDLALGIFVEKYFDKMPVILFKANLLTLCDLILPLVSDQESPENLVKVFKSYDKIKDLGLSKKVIALKDKIENDFDIDFIPYDDEKLMKRIHEELTLHQSCYEEMPDYINLCNTSLFRKEERLVPAYYTENEGHSSILFNANMLFAALNLGFQEQIFDGLKHELGHYMHLANPQNEHLGYVDLLSPDENRVIKKLTPNIINFDAIQDKKTRNKLVNILLLSIYDGLNGEASIFKKTRRVFKNIDVLYLKESDKEVFIGIHKKLESVRRLILKNYIPYALTNPRELVAVAFEFSNSVIPTKKMQELLDKFNMPELKDRSYLSENHPVIKLSRRKKSDNQ